MKNPKSEVRSPKSDLEIQFVGKRRVKEKTVLAEAPTERRNGQQVFSLPSHDEQIKGFTHPDAERLLSLYPKDFKKKTRKGKK